MKGKKLEKLAHAAHIKRHTVGTSNEISLSVLDAAKEQLDDPSQSQKLPRPGGISLFTLPFKRKKPAPTPTKEKGLPLSTGDFVSVDEPASTVSLPTSGSETTPASTVGAKKDAASSVASRPAKDAKVPKEPKVDKQVKPAPPVASPAPKPQLSPEEEIARRKRRRRRSRRLAIAFIVVVTGSLIAAGGTFLYREYQSHTENVSQVQEALNLITDADATFVSLDDAVSDPLSDAAATAAQQLQVQVPAALSKLDQADSLLQSATETMRESMEKQVAFQASATVTARRTLAEKGLAILEQAEPVREGMDQLEAAWQLVVDADTAAREAAALIIDTTDETIQASKQKTEEASALFSQAREGLVAVQTSYPTAGIEPLVSYVDKRIESLGYAVASDDALLARDRVAAAEQNDAYNAADTEAAKLATNLPANPQSLISTVFDRDVSETLQAYSTARLQAASADAFIRDYLGTGTK